MVILIADWIWMPVVTYIILPLVALNNKMSGVFRNLMFMFFVLFGNRMRHVG